MKIVIQAYIPKSLGKPLVDYYKNLSIYNKNSIINFDAFKNKLESKEYRGTTWVPEPVIGSLLGSYFQTDSADIHSSKHTEHTKRLQIQGVINCQKVGKMNLSEIKNIFKTQKSDDSHQCKIELLENYTDTGTVILGSGKYSAKIEYKNKKAEEEELKLSIKNSLAGTYLVKPGTKKESIYDTTTIDIWAAASYPFIKISPAIDIKLNITLSKVEEGTKIIFKGTHNAFPAYELLVNDEIIYSYNPKENGQTGPGFINLRVLTTSFTKVMWESN